MVPRLKRDLQAKTNGKLLLRFVCRQSKELVGRYLQLSPEDNTDQLHTEAYSQSKIQPQQDGCSAGSEPHHLDKGGMKQMSYYYYAIF